MKLLIYVMNRVEKLNGFLHELKERNVSGATIIDGTGMARELMQNDDMNMFMSLRSLFSNPGAPSKVIMMVLKNEEEVNTVLEAIDNVVNLNEPNSGIVFTLPVDFVKGMKR